MIAGDLVLGALLLVTVIAGFSVGAVVLFRPDLLRVVFPRREWEERPFWGGERYDMFFLPVMRIPIGIFCLVASTILLFLGLARSGFIGNAP